MTSYSLDTNNYPIITPSGGSWSSWAQYRYRSDDSAYVYYDLWNTGAADFSYSESDNTNNDGGYQIRVSKSTDSWSDYPHTSSHPPTGVSTTNSVVSLGLEFTFDKPSGTGQTPWTLGGSNVSVNSIFIESNGAWVGGTIADSEPTGSYPVTLNSNLVTTAISHTNGTETPFSIPILDRFGTWHLHQNYVTSALNTPIASVLVSSAKKVFCNFW